MISSRTALPTIIQGGMGIAVSNWKLARAVSMRGQLGVVSGTALDTVLVRRLQDGDPGGDMQRAMKSFPIPYVADRVLELSPEQRRAVAPYPAEFLGLRAHMSGYLDLLDGVREELARLDM